MKKILITLLVCVTCAFAASAQKAELQLGYGGYTQMDATNMHGGHGKVNTAWGALTAGVNFRVMPKLWIGPSYTFSSADFKHGDLNAYYHVIMMNARYEYYRNSIVKLYAHFGIGADITHISDDEFSENKGYFAFQISPLGAEVDLNRTFKLFGEAGFGAQGLIQVGFRVNL
ncbi:MAG: outer membrane beta-barrel protein [Muribaculaceae bacterium]|nr:outer membrane beta-barrel protein [Muribaculaceae bacterium]